MVKKSKKTRPVKVSSGSSHASEFVCSTQKYASPKNPKITRSNENPKMPGYLKDEGTSFDQKLVVTKAQIKAAVNYVNMRRYSKTQP